MTVRSGGVWVDSTCSQERQAVCTKAGVGPNITLHGDEVITLAVGDPFVDPGAEAWTEHQAAWRIGSAHITGGPVSTATGAECVRPCCVLLS